MTKQKNNENYFGTMRKETKKNLQGGGIALAGTRNKLTLKFK